MDNSSLSISQYGSLSDKFSRDLARAPERIGSRNIYGYLPSYEDLLDRIENSLPFVEEGEAGEVQ